MVVACTAKASARIDAAFGSHSLSRLKASREFSLNPFTLCHHPALSGRTRRTKESAYPA